MNITQIRIKLQELISLTLFLMGYEVSCSVYETLGSDGLDEYTAFVRYFDEEIFVSSFLVYTSDNKDYNESELRRTVSQFINGLPKDLEKLIPKLERIKLQHEISEKMKSTGIEEEIMYFFK